MTEFENLVDAAWSAVGERVDKITGRRIDEPDLVPIGEGGPDARFAADFPVLRHLARALELASGGPLAGLAARFASVSHELAWSQNPNYTEANVAPDFLAGYAYAGLAGPDAPVECAAPRCGFVLLGPNVTYADHRHAPKEIYLVLTPGGQWRLDGGEWFDVEAGALIHHDAWQMHATRTADEPFLAFAGWLEPGRRDAIEI